MLLHNNGTWVLCDFGSTTSWAGRYEGSNEIMVAEENIRKYTTPAYRAPEVTLRCTLSQSGTHASCNVCIILMEIKCFPLKAGPWLQMFDLYSRERIDVKADMWVRSMLWLRFQIMSLQVVWKVHAAASDLYWEAEYTPKHS